VQSSAAAQPHVGVSQRRWQGQERACSSGGDALRFVHCFCDIIVSLLVSFPGKAQWAGRLDAPPPNCSDQGRHAAALLDAASSQQSFTPATAVTGCTAAAGKLRGRPPPPQGACSTREGARTRTHHMRKSVSLSTMMCCEVLSCAGAGEGKGGCRVQHVPHAAAHLVVQHNRKAEGILPAPQARQFAQALQTRALTCSACLACCRRC